MDSIESIGPRTLTDQDRKDLRDATISLLCHNTDVQAALKGYVADALHEAGVLTGATFKSSPDVYRRLVDTQYETLVKFLPPKP